MPYDLDEASWEEFSFKQLPVVDNQAMCIGLVLSEICDFISEGIAKGGVLVHCGAGVSRSATAVCAFLMRERSMTAAEALDHVRKSRPCANPNPGFATQLLMWQKEGCKANLDWTELMIKTFREFCEEEQVQVWMNGQWESALFKKRIGDLFLEVELEDGETKACTYGEVRREV